MKKNATMMVLAAAFSAFAVNPITPEGEFLSDPAPRKGPDGKLYVFGSRDELTAGGAYCSHFNDVFVTSDVNAWTIRRGVLASVGANDGIPASDAPLYAPDAIFHDGKWRIFYCMPDKSHKEGVASADSIAGPFKTTFAYDWAKQIDPSIFRDDDGRLYYFWGQFSSHGAVLKPDLSGFEPGTQRDGVIDEARHNFHEGIQLTKRGATYYLVFADVARHGRPTCIGYATAEKPFGPYTYRGVIVDNFGCDPETWNNHGGIVEHGGRWYVVYHRATNASRALRKACVEPIEFGADGSIKEVEMTSNGAGPLLDAFADTPARLACVMSGTVRIETGADGHERLAKVHSGDSATWRYFDVPRDAEKLTVRVVPRKGGIIELRDGNGASYGRVTVPRGDGKTERELEVALERPFPAGRGVVTMGFHGRGGSFCGRNDADIFDVVSFRLGASQAQAAPATLVVGPGEKYATPSAAARAARDGDTVRILPGTYRDACVWRANRLNIVGSSGEVKVLPPEGGRLAERKGLWVLYGSDIHITGISFEGASCTDKNGAGLWIGANSGTTSVDRCTFTRNENGILTTAAPNASISIKDSTFRNCGHGDGYSHNIYVGKIGRLTCEGIVSDHCNQGHCLKSRALATEIVNCRFDDGNDGLSSYLVNCPNGGKVRLARSTLVQSPKPRTA